MTLKELTEEAIKKLEIWESHSIYANEITAKRITSDYKCLLEKIKTKSIEEERRDYAEINRHLHLIISDIEPLFIKMQYKKYNSSAIESIRFQLNFRIGSVLHDLIRESKNDII